MKNRDLKKYCDYCDEEYTAQRADSKYCSASCRQMASKSRINGGSGYRQNHNSLPRNERTKFVSEPEYKPTVNYIPIVKAQEETNSKLIVNQPSINEAKVSTNPQPMVNEALEKINLEIAMLKIKAETSSKVEEGYQEIYKQQLIRDLQLLLKWNRERKVVLSLLKIATTSIADIARAQKEIFKDNPDDYNFLVSEFVPKLKKYIKTARTERTHAFGFSINVVLVDKIQKMVDSLNTGRENSF